MKKDKYLYQAKAFCIKCDRATEFYNSGEQGKVYPMVCWECLKKVKRLRKEFELPHYWTASDGSKWK